MSDMNETTSEKTTIAPEVLVTIARLTTLGREGISRLASMPSDVNRLFNRGTSDGVKITVAENIVNVDLFVILKQDYNAREVSRTIQTKVSRAISEMVGMDVGKINIHIEDIDFNVDKT